MSSQAFNPFLYFQFSDQQLMRLNEIVLILGFLAILFGVPVAQVAIELSRGQQVQFTDLLRHAPTPENLRRYEQTLENRWWGQATVRPVTQRLGYTLLRDPGSRALLGRDGWVFYRPGVQYLLQGDGALDNVPNTGLWIVAQPESTHSENVARAIVRFRDQLRNRGIELLVVPVPGKASIYPDRLTRRVTASQVLRSPTATLLSDLQREGIATVDLFELFRSAKNEARGSSEGEPLYLATDTHWTPYGARLAAEVVAQRVLQMGCGPEFAWELPVASIRVARRGDVPQMTEVPGLAESFPPQVVTCTQVTDKIVGLMVPPPGGRDGTYMSSHLKDSPREPTVLLLGDSYSRIYQLPEPRSLGRVIHSSGDPVTTASEPLTAVKRWLPGSAGFPSLLAEALQTPIDYIISDGGAATDVRQRLSLNAEILENKLIVVWEFTERDIALGRQGWQDVPLPPEL